MKGRWGRRVFGRIEKGPTTTRFRLEVQLDNQLVVYRQFIAANEDLKNERGAYQFILDKMTEELSEQVRNRIYTP